MSTKPKSATPVTDKARKAALAEIDERINGTPNGSPTTPAAAKATKGAKAKAAPKRKTPKAAKPTKRLSQYAVGGRW